MRLSDGSDAKSFKSCRCSVDISSASSPSAPHFAPPWFIFVVFPWFFGTGSSPVWPIFDAKSSFPRIVPHLFQSGFVDRPLWFMPQAGGEKFIWVNLSPVPGPDQGG